jgi:hypothetical protein
MLMKDWGEFAKTLQFRVETGTEPRPRPTPKALDAYEVNSGLRLPESYRGFVLAAGAGMLCRAFEIVSRGNSAKERASIESLNELYREPQTPDVLREYSNDPERTLRLHIFCNCLIRNTFIGWDPGETMDLSRNEYAIHEPQRTYGVTRLVDTFDGFLEDHVLGDGFLQYVGGEWDEDDFGPRREFMPANRLTPRKKRRSPAGASKKAGRRRGEGSTDAAKRNIKVLVGLKALGTFALPVGSGDAPTDEVRRLLIPPTRAGDNVVWTEVGDDGETRSMIWIPNGEADRVEMERFFEAASAAGRDEG